ncbi:MAG: glucosaminidase domain-containing protein [Lewinellaceae bacterium]|nr:glucosaminidase domain-containing protein [Lewinellaceae bacterium]
MKKSFEPETTGQQGYIQKLKEQRQKKSAVSKSTQRQFQDPEALPLDILFRQIWVRLRRNWIALKYRADSLTLGMFRKQMALKLSVIGVSGYILLGSNREFTILSSTKSGDLPEGMSIMAENNLDGSKGSRSILVPAKMTKELPKLHNNVEASGKPSPAKISNSKLINADAQTRRYIERFHKIAMAEMERYGVPASISLAQGLIESRAGNSTLAAKNNNHFGIKCFARNCGKGHCTNHTDDSHKDFFRNYKSAWESWRAHSIMISTGRYAKLKKYGSDYKKWAYGLRQLGYATDRTYADKLIGIIERYDLHRYDR